MGVGILRNLDCENYDNGTYRISFENDAVVLEQSPDGEKDWKRLDNDQLRKHEYWQKTEDSEGILADIIAKNKPFFQPEVEVAK